MPIPTVITDLSTKASSNYPDGDSESPIVLDDVQRAHAAFIAQLRDDPTANILAAVPFAKGGTGATTASAARTALGLVIGTDVAAIASPTFTGTPAAPTAAGATNTTQIATTAMVQAAIPLSTAITGVRRLAQTSTATRATVGTGTTQIPSTDSIPTITQGDEYLTISFTPTNAASTLKIRGSCTAAHTVAGVSLAMGLFQDAISNALDVGFATVPAASYCVPLDVDHSMTAGTTSAITFRLRVGGDAAGTTTVNGATGTRRYGGTSLMRITVDEYLP